MHLRLTMILRVDARSATAQENTSHVVTCPRSVFKYLSMYVWCSVHVQRSITVKTRHCHCMCAVFLIDVGCFFGCLRCVYCKDEAVKKLWNMIERWNLLFALKQEHPTHVSLVTARTSMWKMKQNPTERRNPLFAVTQVTRKVPPEHVPLMKARTSTLRMK